jgi:hypothetical protein
MVYYSCQHSGYRRNKNSHLGSFFLGGGRSGGRGGQFVIRLYITICSICWGGGVGVVEGVLHEVINSC